VVRINQRERIERRNQIEQVLQIKLDAIIEKIKRDGITDTNMAQSAYNKELNDVLRAGIQESYQLAVDYVTSKRKTTGFLTSADLEIIRDQVDKYSIRFWRKVDMILHRNDVLLQKYNYEPRSPLNSNYMASVLAIAIVTTTMAKGTIAKIAQLKSTVKSAGFGSILNLFKNVFLSQQGGTFGVPRDEFEDQVQWNAILDAKTCPTCIALNGSYWYYNDPHKPIPGDEGDIHDNCRCMWDYLPSILDIPLAVQLAKLTRQTEYNTILDFE
jgi:hypothetical protein